MEERLAVLLQALQGYQPQRVILFGSTARGDTDAAMMATLCPPGIHADILVYTPEEIALMVADKNPFILQALAEGKVVYEAKS